MATATIYSTVGYNHIRTGDTWSGVRAGGGTIASSQQDGTGPSGKVLLNFSSPDYSFHRPYFEFDLSSSIPTAAIIQSMEFQIQSIDSTVTQKVYFGYSGTSSLNGSSEEYNYVYDNIISGTPVAVIDNWVASTFSSSSLDISTYPPSKVMGKDGPLYWAPYVIGGVTVPDWDNATNGTANELRLYGSAPTSGRRPKLIVTYTAGYPNTVIGVPGANISTVSGVPSANISKIMGA